MVLLMFGFLLVKGLPAIVFHVEIFLGLLIFDLMRLVVTAVLFVANLRQLFDSLDRALFLSGLISKLI